MVSGKLLKFGSMKKLDKETVKLLEGWFNKRVKKINADVCGNAIISWEDFVISLSYVVYRVKHVKGLSKKKREDFLKKYPFINKDKLNYVNINKVRHIVKIRKDESIKRYIEDCLNGKEREVRERLDVYIMAFADDKWFKEFKKKLKALYKKRGLKIRKNEPIIVCCNL